MRSALTFVLAAWALYALMEYFFPTPYDDTDAPPKRSGMVHYVDYGTGCEYIAPRLGGLTPRLNAEGKHICERPGWQR
jgi:hypothetical protein